MLVAVSTEPNHLLSPEVKSPSGKNEKITLPDAFVILEPIFLKLVRLVFVTLNPTYSGLEISLLFLVKSKTVKLKIAGSVSVAVLSFPDTSEIFTSSLETTTDLIASS